MSLDTYLQKHPELEQRETYSHNDDAVGNETPLSPAEPVSVTPIPQKSKRGMITIVIFLLVLILLGVTCPSKETHEQTITTVIKDKIGEEESFDKMDYLLMNTLGGSLIKYLLGNTLEVKNYLVFSIGTIHTPKGENKTVTFGILGHVFIIGEINYQ